MVSIARLARVALAGTLSVAAASGVAHVGAQAISPELYAGLTWRCVGPFDGGPVASVVGESGQPGVYVITTPSGGAWKTTDGGGTWSALENAHPQASSADPHRWIDPVNPRRIVRTDSKGIEVSLDAGQTWVASHNLPIADIAGMEPRDRPREPRGRRRIDGKPSTISITDPARPGLVFAGTSDGVYVSFDDGVEWQSLRLNMPLVAVNDLDFRGNNLVVSTAGRAQWQLDDISPLRQLSGVSASAPAMLFKPADAIVTKTVNVDYYLGPATRGDVTIEITDAANRVVHAARSTAQDPADLWLPVTRPLPATPGHHRIEWNLRFDPPPAQKHRYAQMARAAFEEMPPDPDGPRVLAGTYRVKLTVAGRSFSQTLVVRDEPGATPAAIADARREFDFAMKIYDAMQITHRAFLQIARARSGLSPLLASTDDQTAALATGLDARLVQLDGTDWTGLILPEEDQDDFDPDEAEEQGIKHPDFIPPKPVSVSKDYDDPTTILGRKFFNVNHAPALTIVSSDLGTMLTKVMTTPDVVTAADYDRTCQQLVGVLDTWRATNAGDLARANTELTRLKLPALPIAATVPAIACK